MNSIVNPHQERAIVRWYRHGVNRSASPSWIRDSEGSIE